MRIALTRWAPRLVLALAAAAWLLWLFGDSRPAASPAPLPVPQPLVRDYEQVTHSETPPTQAQCSSAGRRCFSPQAIRAAYNLPPLYAAGKDGRGRTIAIIDSYGNDNMAHDLHVFDQAFHLAPLCGEESVKCDSTMGSFKELAVQGSPATK